MGRQVALKILAPELTRDERFRSRFEKEIRLQAALHHPNIAIAYDAGHDGPLHYLAMEYMEGQSLDQVIQSKGPFSEKNALRILRKVAVGLSYAWKTASLIHRDIKPSNIMIDEEGKVKVLDMGVSKSLKNKEGKEDSSHLIVGTPRYMPPEQMRGDESIDHRADIYALGATLYHMLTGQSPFPFASVAEVVEAQTVGPAPSPRDLNPEISSACVHLIRVMMAVKPENRYPYWSSLIADISRVLSGQKPMTAVPAKEDSLVAASSGKLPEKQLKINPAELKKKTRSAASREPVQAVPNKGLLALVGLLVILAAALFFADSRRPGSVEVVDPPAEARPALSTPAKEPPSERAPGGATGMPVEEPEPVAQLAAAELVQLQDLYSFITNRMEELPENFSDHMAALERLKADAESFGFSRYLLLAEELEEELMARKNSAKRTLMTELQEKAERFWKEGKYAQSSQIWKDYQGPLAKETFDARAAKAEEYKTRNDKRVSLEGKKSQKAEETVKRLVRLASSQILSGGNLTKVLGAIEEAAETYQDSELRTRIIEIASCVKEVQQMEFRLLDQYREEMGRVVSLETERGSIPVQIMDITNGYLYVERQLEQGFLGMVFKAEDLTLGEQLLRLEQISDRYTDLRMAVLVLREGDFARALGYLESDATAIGGALKMRIEKMTAPDAPAVAVKKPETPETIQVQKLKQDLSLNNPRYRGGGDFRVDNGLVTAVNLQEAEGEIQDLTPLQGLPLRYLSVSGLSIDNLEPLLGMPLETVILLNTGVESLQPLSGMKLARLSLQGSEKIWDISALQGMPLAALDLRGTKVSHLLPVHEAPLTSLMLSDQFKETMEFEHFPLAHLDVSGSRITSLEGLTNMPLHSLYLVDVPIHDVTPLAKLPLEQLRFNPQTIHAGLNVLREIPSLEKLADSLDGDYLPADVFWGRHDRGFDLPRPPPD
jgi:hypothetical protein